MELVMSIASTDHLSNHYFAATWPPRFHYIAVRQKWPKSYAITPLLVPIP